MKKCKSPPPIIRVLEDFDESLSRISLELGLSYEKNPVDGSLDVIEFKFEEMEDSILFELLSKIPREKFAYRANISG